METITARVATTKDSLLHRSAKSRLTEELTLALAKKIAKNVILPAPEMLPLSHDNPFREELIYSITIQYQQLQS